MSDSGKLLRGIYGPLPKRFDQSSADGEHTGLAISVMRKVGSECWPTLEKVKAHRSFSEAVDDNDFVNMAGSTASDAHA
eukprot:6367139-Pyramimonas_sp.AAC.1